MMSTTFDVRSFVRNRNTLIVRFLFLVLQDENQDGVFTVEELIRWIDEHKLVEFVEEDRDAEMDQIMESQASSQSKEEEDQAAAKK